VATQRGWEKQRFPFRAAVIGGALSSTLLTLVLLPVLYTWAEKSRRPTNVENLQAAK